MTTGFIEPIRGILVELISTMYFDLKLIQVMPFSVMQGGKYVAHVLLKRKPRKAVVFVRTKGGLIVMKRKAVIKMDK